VPSGRLATADLVAGVTTVVYTAPGGKSFNIKVNICNRNDSDVRIRLAFVNDGGLDSLTEDDYLEYNVLLRANGLIIRDGINLAGYQSIIGYSDTGNVNFQVWD